MKLQTPNKKSATQALVMGASTGIGVALGRGSNEFYPASKQTSGIAKIATSFAMMALLASVKGDDHLSAAIKGGTAGIAGEKLIGGISDLLVDQKVIETTANDNDAKKFLLRALDVKDCGCSSTNSTTNTKRLILPSLNYAQEFSPIQMQEDMQGVFTASQFV